MTRKIATTQSTPPDPYTIEEWDALLRELRKLDQHPGQPLYLYYCLGFYSGMRTSELLGLQPSSIERPYIRVDQVWVRGRMEPRTKTHEARKVYLTARTWKEIEPLCFGRSLFTQADGEPYKSDKAMRRLWN